MDKSLLASLANLAETMGLLPHQAMALPLVVENCATKLGTTKSEMVWKLQTVTEAREYVASVIQNDLDQDELLEVYASQKKGS